MKSKLSREFIEAFRFDNKGKYYNGKQVDDAMDAIADEAEIMQEELDCAIARIAELEQQTAVTVQKVIDTESKSDEKAAEEESLHDEIALLEMKKKILTSAVAEAEEKYKKVFTDAIDEVKAVADKMESVLKK